MTQEKNINEYLSGAKLIGDDYDELQILQWYEQEKNAYAGLLDSQCSYSYEYHSLNQACGFNELRKVPSGSLRTCCFGSAFGDELQPIVEAISTTVLIDSASSFLDRPLGNGVRTILAQASGAIDMATNSLDLITCFGVLHHIPNVSFVISEFYRCLDVGGLLMVREPITSMGDWRYPREGVTQNERGLPSDIFKGILLGAGFEILKYNPCVFPPFAVAMRKLGLAPYNSKVLVWIDLLLSRAFRWNCRYHRLGFWDKFAPASDFYVCRKR